jgi:hypothetical protein
VTEKITPFCYGCGSTKTIEELRAEKPTVLSCCPERRMVVDLGDVVTMGDALAEAARVFAWYAKLHAEKATPEGDEKAARNTEFAEQMLAALPKGRNP